MQGAAPPSATELARQRAELLAAQFDMVVTARPMMVTRWWPRVDVGRRAISDERLAIGYAHAR